MRFVIDILALAGLLIFFWRGWRKGLLLALLGVVRVVLASGLAYFMGRYVGPWLGELFYRPCIIMIPVAAGLTFVLVNFAFQIAIWKIREKRRIKKAKDESFHLSWYQCLGGGLVGSAAGLLTLIFVFWLTDLSITGITGHGIPDADRSTFGRFSRRATYEAVYAVTARQGRESQAAAIARMVSNPARGLDHLQQVLAADSVRSVLSDRQLPEDLLSGDPERIRANESIQQLFSDQDTRRELEELGIISRNETEASFCEKLSRFGRNENIQASLQDLKARDLLRTDKILKLIRDPAFDVIVQEVVE